jgi:hypothetical protein
MSEDLKRQILDLQAYCHRLESAIKEVNKKIEQVFPLLETRECANNSYSLIEKTNEFLAEEQKKNFEEFKTVVSNKFQLLQYNIGRNQLNIDSLAEKDEILEKEIDRIKEKEVILYETSISNLKSLQESIRKEIKEAIESIPKSKIITAQEVNDSIDLKLAAVAIDAKNGVLRSANCDMRIGIAEKKIDQIFLLLQRHSLNQ